MFTLSYQSVLMLLSDHTIKVWSVEGLSDAVTLPINLKAKAVVAAHDKDINSVAVAPNDSLVCSGSQVGIPTNSQFSPCLLLFIVVSQFIFLKKSYQVIAPFTINFLTLHPIRICLT